LDTSDQLKIQLLSDAIAFLLLAVYVAGIIFTFITHKHLFFVQLSPETREGKEKVEQIEGREEDHRHWSKKKSFVLLGISMAGVVIVSEILVGSVEATIKEFGSGELFVGAIIIGIVGNAAEHSSAIILARKERLIYR
jgi:Ca2+:H+ antiporter